ncbi:MAG: amino acid ABC transporter permease [Proteobacteria bacterium]|nr:amino acid ABC transporter permease [Pseudomonadota bacterium]
MPIEFSFFVRFLPNLLEGTVITLELSVLAIVAALVWGMVLALGMLSGRRALALPAGAFVQFMRNTPLLVQLYIVYFGFAMAGFGLSSFVSGLIALTAQNSAYIAEIYRGGLQSISRTQIDAGKALGMSRRDVFELIELPLAFMRVVPPLCNQFILIIKDTSIVSAIAVGELMYQGKLLSERTAATYEIFFMVGLFYLVITSVVAFGTRIFERRFAIVH